MKRPSSLAPPLPELDGLRGAAALLIAGYHAWSLSGQARLGGGPWRDVVSSGHVAISFFFVLSGLVLFWPMALRGGDAGPVGGYLRRRAARILPAYYVVLLLGIALYPLLFAGPARLADDATWESVLAHLLVVQNEARLLPGYKGALGLGVNAPVWTLSVEVWFYLALPFVAVAFARRPARWVIGAVAVAVGGRLLLAFADLGLSARTSALVLSSFPLHAIDFAIGMAAAVWLARHREQHTGRAWTLPTAVAAGSALVVVMAVLGGPDAATARDQARESALAAVAIPVLFALCAVWLVLTPGGCLASRPARWLGQISYGIFLGHFLIIGLARGTFGFATGGSTSAFLAMELVVLSGSIAWGWVSWKLVEAPARAWARRTSTGHKGGEVLGDGHALHVGAGHLDER